MVHSIPVSILSQSRLFRETIAARFQAEPGIELVGTAERIEALLAISRARPIGVLLVDLSFERSGSVETVRDILLLLPQARIIVLGPEQSESEIIRYVEAGARAYLECNASCATLFKTVKAVSRDRPSCCLRVLARMIERIHQLAGAGKAPAPCPAKELTFREMEVARWTASGLVNKQIARRLGVKASTIKTHVHNILKKLELKGRRDLIQRAGQYGLLEEGWATSTKHGWPHDVQDASSCNPFHGGTHS